MKVLIADDSNTSRHMLERTLQRWGYDVVSARDGTEAWKLLQNQDAPALAILDWMMPGYSGPEICKMVREQAREPYIYILLLTSRSQKEDTIEGMESGADDYVTKPFDHHELEVRLRAGKRILQLQAELVSAREALREQATRDSLTKLWNRSSILETLQREVARAEREATCVGVVMLDLDHFKRVNDTHGHLAGDAVLRETAQRLLGAVRPYDSIGRYGGEEFLIILPGCDEKCVESRAEQMRAAVAGKALEYKGLSLEVTASFGATIFYRGLAGTPDALIHIADEALYEAKKRGRNSVVLFSGVTPSRGHIA